MVNVNTEELLKRTYVSMVGKKVRDGLVEMPGVAKNRIRCIVTGKIVYITNQRLAAGIKKYGSEEALRVNYVCREAKSKP